MSQAGCVMSGVGEERRRHERVDSAVCTWLSFPRERAAYSTLTMDLSAGGARFSTEKSVAVGEPLFIQMQLPSNNIECKACVCWCTAGEDDNYIFGVQFLDLAAKDREPLERFIRAVLRLEGSAV